jgi:hypothetical protein
VAAAVLASAAIAAPPALGLGDDATTSGPYPEPKNGLYRGTTTQGAAVSFRVRDGKVRNPSYRVSGGGCGMRVTFPTPAPVLRGRFFFGERSSSFFSGRFFTRQKAAGVAAVDFAASACPSAGVAEVRFHAQLVR